MIGGLAYSLGEGQQLQEALQLAQAKLGALGFSLLENHQPSVTMMGSRCGDVVGTMSLFFNKGPKSLPVDELVSVAPDLACTLVALRERPQFRIAQAGWLALDDPDDVLVAEGLVMATVEHCSDHGVDLILLCVGVEHSRFLAHCKQLLFEPVTERFMHPVTGRPAQVLSLAVLRYASRLLDSYCEGYKSWYGKNGQRGWTSHSYAQVSCLAH